MTPSPIQPPFSNGLTPAQAERLAMLAEEAGEVVQIVGKILRHGLHSTHPDSPDLSNRSLLRLEVADFLAVARLLIAQGDMGQVTEFCLDKARERKLTFSHHQIAPNSATPEHTSNIKRAAIVFLGEIEKGDKDANSDFALAVCAAHDAFTAYPINDSDASRYALGIAFLHSLAGTFQ